MQYYKGPKSKLFILNFSMHDKHTPEIYDKFYDVQALYNNNINSPTYLH